MFLVLLVAVGVFVAVRLAETPERGDRAAFWQTLRRADKAWLTAALFCTCVSVLCDVKKLQVFLRATGVAARFRVALRAVLTGKFYDGITPLALGGQPAQMVVLSQTEPLGAATAAPTLSYLIQSFTGIFVAGCLMLGNPHALIYAEPSVKTVFTVAAGVGLCLNALGPLALVLLTVAPHLIETIAEWLVKAAEKLRWSKNGTLRTRVQKGIFNYKSAVRWMAKQKEKLLVAVGWSVVGTLALFSVPYCLFVSLGGVNCSGALWLDTVTLNCFLLYSSACFPLPGGTGYAETVFSFFFSGIRLQSNVLCWIVLLWRFFTYYVFLVYGIAASAVRFLSSLLRRKKER